MSEIIEINTDNIHIEENSELINKTRQIMAAYDLNGNNSDVTIYIQAYNGLGKTKNCVESVLENTKDVNYDLLLADNGSTDGTFDYFKSVPYEKKRILHFTKNCGSPLPWMFVSVGMLSRYVVMLNNDIVVTKNWLSNLLKVAESDERIGMVNPVSSNTSNYQGVLLDFANYDEMQKKAAQFNISNSKKWHERLRLITLGTLFRKECLCAIGLPLFDVGFSHNFGDDDIAFRVRRAGYKAFLAKDTWVHHDDVKKNLTIDQAIKINRDLEIGRENFKTKYFGIDAWSDVNNYINDYIGELSPIQTNDKDKVLGIDVRCGTPILEIKNYLKHFDIFNTECFAFTTKGKYFLDLQTVCGTDNVFCGNIDYFSSCFDKKSFDQIVIGEDVNTYSDPFKVINNAFDLLKDNGQLFFSVQNSMNIFALLYATGNTNINNTVHAINYTAEEFLSQLLQKQYNARFIAAGYIEPDKISKEISEQTERILQKLSVKEMNETMFRLKAERFYYSIRK